VCTEHPHHTLLQLFALVHGKSVTGANKTLAEQTPHIDDKIRAAHRVLTDLRRHSTSLAKLVDNTENALKSYIDLANVNVKKVLETVARDSHKNLLFSALSSEPPTVQRFKDLLRREISGTNRASVPCVITVTPDVNAREEDLVRIHGFEPRFDLTDSGVNRPIIITCWGSDGKKYRQVVKHDDVRPDAVMMQVRDARG
jgi:serine-protein kinase ATM